MTGVQDKLVFISNLFDYVQRVAPEGEEIAHRGSRVMKQLIRSGTIVLSTLALSAPAQTDDTPYFSAMRWRMIGPHRAGRVWTVAGVPGNPAVYYLGTPAGSGWKTTNGGLTWASMTDGIGATGIGIVTVAPSNPDIVYIGTGSNQLGSGVYRSNDAGTTWKNIGLADTKFITGLLVDPSDPDTLLAAVGSGGNFGTMVFYNNNKSADRGVHRTTDGGLTWAHTLFVDDQSSVVDLVSDGTQGRVVFATLTAGAAGANAGPPIYRSEDGGATWRRLAAVGLPAGAASANLAVAPGTNNRRLYAITGGRGGGGLYRSDDGGSTWALMTTRLASAGGRLYVDPKNPDILYTMGTSVYRSTDGGRTLNAYKGAPGGDDPHALWIDPTNPQRMILGADQGPSISPDGGKSWSPWYTIFNGEHYFVSTDQQFPYRVYAAQQDSGTVSILSRSDFGAIRPNDWYPVSGYEQGHIFGDPLNPRYVYSHGDGHAITRFDRETGQSGPVYTPSSEDHFGPRPGFEMSRKDPRFLFYGAQYVLASTDRVTWKKISPDLTVRPGSPPPPPPSPGVRPPNIVALAPSPLDVSVLWAGTSNGIIQLSRDGGATWTDVTPPRLVAEATLTLWSMEASAYDAGVAYASAIDLSDAHGPCLLRTADFGRTWQSINSGLPADVPTRVVREDLERSNLLYAGTQKGIFVSFDRGEHWQSLQLNLPAVSVNDITIHDRDLVIATWGRALWILDDVSPLRQIETARANTAAAFLFAPAPAVRVRGDNNQDTPLPPEVPQGQNPPEGAIIDYFLRDAPRGPMTLSIHDDAGGLVRQFTSVARTMDAPMPNAPEYWFKGPDVLGVTAGMHRIAWDLRYETPPSLDFGPDGNPSYSTSYGIIAAAVIGQSPRQQPVGPLVLPGVYQVRLNAGGVAITREVRVSNDPRSTATAADLAALSQAERGLAAGIGTSRNAIERVRALRAAAAERAKAAPSIGGTVKTFDTAALGVITALAGNRALGAHLAALEFADLRPTESTAAALRASCAKADETLLQYKHLLDKDLGALNAALSGVGLAALNPAANVASVACSAH